MPAHGTEPPFTVIRRDGRSRRRSRNCRHASRRKRQAVELPISMPCRARYLRSAEEGIARGLQGLPGFRLDMIREQLASGTKDHADNDPGLRASAIEHRCRWPTSPGRSIRSYGAGSNTTDGTRPRHCPPCSDTLTRRFWLGRCGSSSALGFIRSVRVAFCKASQRKTRNFSYTGGSE